MCFGQTVKYPQPQEHQRRDDESEDDTSLTDWTNIITSPIDYEEESLSALHDVLNERNQYDTMNTMDYDSCLLHHWFDLSLPSSADWPILLCQPHIHVMLLNHRNFAP